MTEEQRLTAEELEAIRERADKATAGEWTWDINEHGDIGVAIPKGHSIGMGNMEGFCGECIGNAEFIAHSREDIPRLLAHISEQSRTIAALSSLVDKLTEVTSWRRFFNDHAEGDWYCAHCLGMNEHTMRCPIIMAIDAKLQEQGQEQEQA